MRILELDLQFVFMPPCIEIPLPISVAGKLLMRENSACIDTYLASNRSTIYVPIDLKGMSLPLVVSMIC